MSDIGPLKIDLAYPRVARVLRAALEDAPQTELLQVLSSSYENAPFALLDIFEKVLTDLEEYNAIDKMFNGCLTPPAKSDGSELRRCFVDSSIGCIDGMTCNLTNMTDEHRTEVSNTGIKCAGWINGKCSGLPRASVDKPTVADCP